MLGVGKLIIVLMLCLIFVIIGLLARQIHLMVEEDRAFREWMKEFKNVDR